MCLYVLFFPSTPSITCAGNFHGYSALLYGYIVQNTISNYIALGAGTYPMFSILRDLFKKTPHRIPQTPISISHLRPDMLNGQDMAVWFGHSALLLELDNTLLLLDPTFADSPSPFPLVGGKRFSRILPLEPEQLPAIDIVILSHDHYDHLDYHSIMRIKNKVGLFCVPRGVGSHLRGWGIEEQKIKEFSWWDELAVNGIKLACTPSQHFSGRGLFDRNSTLWCSWSILGRQHRVFFSGDGGYGPHFAAIGDKYGPFTVTLMECGQYDPRWAAIHMRPEETVQAHLAVKGELLMPIHWAAFSLAFHSWTDPIERVTQAAKEHQVTVTTPKIGEPVLIGSETYPTSAWWR